MYVLSGVSGFGFFPKVSGSDVLMLKSMFFLMFFRLWFCVCLSYFHMVSEIKDKVYDILGTIGTCGLPI